MALYCHSNDILYSDFVLYFQIGSFDAFLTSFLIYNLFLCPKGVIDALCEACEKLKWSEPTKIQKEAIPLALAGIVRSIYWLN